MSNFISDAIHPTTGKVEQATWLDDHFGRHCYGVKFADGSVWPARSIRTPQMDADAGNSSLTADVRADHE